MTSWTIGHDDAAVRVMAQVRRYTPPDEPDLTRRQVAAVLHALADHTALAQAVGWSGEGPAESVGRWLHDLGDHITLAQPTGDRPMTAEDRTHYEGDGCPEHPMHLGPCVRALDGDVAQDCLDTTEVDGELLVCDRPAGHAAAHSCVLMPAARMAWIGASAKAGEPPLPCLRP